MILIRSTKKWWVFLILLGLIFTSIYLYACPKVLSVAFKEQIVALGDTTKMTITIASQTPLPKGECLSNGKFKFTSTSNRNFGVYSGDNISNDYVFKVDKQGTFNFTVSAYGECKGGPKLGEPTKSGVLIVPVVADIKSDVTIVSKSKSITFTATSSESDKWPKEQPKWKSSRGGTFKPETGPVTVWTPDKVSDAENDCEITAKCGLEDGKSIKVTVVELNVVKYFDEQGKEQNIPNPFYVGNKSTIKFKAYPKPGNKWPKDDPIWGGEASGGGEEKSVTFAIGANNTGSEEAKTISATCGKKIEYKILVCPVPSVTLEPGGDYPVTNTIPTPITHYDIVGNTEGEITVSLGNPTWALTETIVEPPNFIYSTPEVLIKGYKVIKFKGNVSFTKWPVLNLSIKKMPQWINLGSTQNLSLKTKWNTFYSNLKTHEMGHIQRSEKFSSQAAKLFNNGTFNGYAENEKKASEIMKTKAEKERDDIVKAHKDDQDLYDSPIANGGTNHGESQGAVWPQP